MIDWQTRALTAESDLTAVKRERDEAIRDRDHSIGTTLSMKLSAKLKTAEAVVARLTAERDEAWNEAMETAELACLRGRDLYRRNDEGYDDIREAVADGLAITIRALHRPLPGGET